MEVTIEITDAEAVSHDISDLLCWWQGFKEGKGEDFNPVANHGIEAARKLNIQIKDELRKDINV